MIKGSRSKRRSEEARKREGTDARQRGGWVALTHGHGSDPPFGRRLSCSPRACRVPLLLRHARRCYCGARPAAARDEGGVARPAGSRGGRRGGGRAVPILQPPLLAPPSLCGPPAAVAASTATPHFSIRAPPQHLGQLRHSKRGISSESSATDTHKQLFLPEPRILEGPHISHSGAPISLEGPRRAVSRDLSVGEGPQRPSQNCFEDPVTSRRGCELLCG